MVLSAFQSFFRPRPPQPARDSYIALLAQSRNPFFYTSAGVPDTLDGRFELIVLHLFLLQDRLHAEAPEFAQFLSEVFLEAMDTNLREQGVGDSGVLHRIRKMGKVYHGALQAYATDDDELLKAALARNLYGTVTEGDPKQLVQMAQYVRRVQKQLAATDTAVIASGNYAWASPD